MRQIVVLWCCLALMGTALTQGVPGQEPDGMIARAWANQLARLGEDEHSAFLQYLRHPGAEYLAAKLGRRKPEDYLTLLREQGGAAPLPIRKLLEGDLLLAVGKGSEALACYREVVAHIGKTNADGWAQGLMPAEYYPVEPPSGFAANPYSNGVPAPEAAQPFTWGPGSSRDNWLIQRFIALAAWEDAEKEFARIWAIHLRYTRPYDMTTSNRAPDGGKTITVQPAGFTGRGLQFALDYADFLQRRQQNVLAVDVFMAPLLLMDMDRNPDGVGVPYGAAEGDRFVDSQAGITRKEYLRQAYGELQAQGKESALAAALQEQIAKPDNRARRVLAQVRMLQGKNEEALALELAYLSAAHFDPLTTAYRSGMVYEAAAQPEKAIVQYERALALSYTPPNVPEDDDDIAPRMRIMSPVDFPGNPQATWGRAQFQQEVLTRLQRLYRGLGQADRILALTLRQYELNDGLLDNLELLQTTAARFSAAGQQARFTAWATARRAAITDPLAKANLSWVRKDYPGTIAALVRLPRGQDDRTDPYEPWKERFRRLDRVQLRALLGALVAANPKDYDSRLERLEVTEYPDGPEAMHALEALLAADVPDLFGCYRLSFRPTQFHNFDELAYRLLRLYEKAGDEDKLTTLGLRLLAGGKPFPRLDLSTLRLNWNGFGIQPEMEERLQAAYLLLPHVKKPADVERLRALAAKIDCLPLSNQLAHLLNPRHAPRLDPTTLHSHRYPHVTVQTSGLPAGVRLLTNRDDVRAFSPDGQWIGTSWGLVRYRVGADGGLQVLQLPLGMRISDILSTQAGLFVGTPSGLFRLDDAAGEKPVMVRVGLESAEEPTEEVRVGWSEGGVPSVGHLYWWKNAVWISGRDSTHGGRHIWRYDPAHNEVHRFDKADGILFPGTDRLCSSHAVYDEKSGDFIPLAVNSHDWSIIGVTAHEIWVDVQVDDELCHRPALVDAGTLAVRVLPIANARPGEKLLIHQPFQVLAEDAGHVWLLGDEHLTVYDRVSGELRPLKNPEGDGQAGSRCSRGVVERRRRGVFPLSCRHGGGGAYSGADPARRPRANLPLAADAGREAAAGQRAHPRVAGRQPGQR